ncbi:hypothetical protein ACHWQZ_G000766 [Mnemiopsis leidyi]
MVSCLLCFTILIIFTGSYGYQDHVCEDKTLKIDCGFYSIFITDASYGAKNNSLLNCGAFKEDCHSQDSLSEMQERCNEQRKCNVRAKNDIFKDPCSGIRKHLFATWECNPDNCPAGTYRRPYIDPTCTECGTNTFSASGAAECTECSAGTVANEAHTNCVECPAGTYRTSEMTTCTKCDTNTISKTGAAVCTGCGAGTVANEANTECEKCPAGSYRTSEMTTCTKCDTNSISTSGAAVCTVCESGTVANVDYSDCEACPPGTYRSTDMDICTECGTNTFSASGAAECTGCSAGTVANEASTECVECPAGTYRSLGMTTCTKCDTNTISKTGAAVCTGCGAGTVSNVDHSDCEACPPGTYRSTDMDICTECGTNTFSASGAAECTVCSAGTVANEAHTNCVECPAGTYRTSEMTTCTKCDTNTISKTGAAVCTVCESGTVANEASTECEECPAGTYRTSEMTTCAKCDTNTISKTGAAVCAGCGAGTVANEASTECERCPAGTYRTSEMTTCTKCDTNSISTSGAAVCTVCESGTVSNVDHSDCEACPPGKYRSTDMDTCSECETNYFSGSGAHSCTFCGTGSVSNADNTACEACPAGTYRYFGMTTCTKCETYSISTSGSRSCTVCESGTVANEANTECVECDAGQYRYIEDVECKECKDNTISQAGAAYCTVCPEGTEANANKTRCDNCTAGTYRSSGITTCTKCDTNSISKSGASICTGCEPGTAANEAKTDCVHCEAGTYRNSSMTTCTKCDTNTVSKTRATVCTVCEAGTVANVDYSQCERCPAGTYRSSNMTNCTECDRGSLPGRNKTSCVCRLGWYSEDGDKPPCTQCEDRDKCRADISDSLSNIDQAAESGDTDTVTIGLLEIVNLEIRLTDSDVGQLVKTLTATQRLLVNASGDVGRLNVAVVETIEFIKDSKTSNFNESSQVIQIIESASKTLSEGENITTFSIVAQSIVPKDKEVELTAPMSVLPEDLPLRLDLGIMQGERANVAVMDQSYKDILPKTEDEKTTIGSPIVSIIFTDVADTSNISFSLVFQQKEHPEYRTGYNIERKCVYLNTTTNTWLSNGCKTLLNTERTCTCTCSHTTSFAVLLSPTPVTNEEGQEVVSYVMFGINILFLSLTFVLISPFKALRKRDIVIAQLNLIVSLMLGNITFVVLSATSSIAVDDTGAPLLSLNAGCITGVIISQYFFLSAFFWMGCIAWTFFNKIVRAVKTFGKTDKHYFRNCALLSWICPVIFPLASFLFSLIPNRSSEYTMPYVGGNRENGSHCWVEDPWRYIGFLVPAYLILLFNCVCFGMVAKVILNSTGKPGGSEAVSVKTAKAMMVVAVSVGLPWIVAGLAVGPAASFMQYLFIIFIGLQGPLLFVALVVLQEETRANTKSLLKRFLPSKPAEGIQDKTINLYSPGPSKNFPETQETSGDQLYSNVQEETVQQTKEDHIYSTVQDETALQEGRTC